MYLLRRLSVFALLLMMGCGGGEARTAAEARSAPTHGQARHPVGKVVLASRVDTVPDRCPPGAAECLPPIPWVHKLCDRVHPDIALYFFRAGTPWQRFYMLERAKPYNASGGMSLLGDNMEPGEEVIALRRHNGEGGIQIGDSTGYDVLRWNGSCATIHDGEFSTLPPRRGKGHSRVEWRYLSDDLQRVLSADPDIMASTRDRRRHCQGATIGVVSQECVQSDRRLIEDIVRYVRTSRNLPTPSAIE
jgi:hypothetical protein